MSSAAGGVLTAADITASPAWFPLRVGADAGSLTLLRLDEAGYAAASFLDERLLTATPPQALCPAATVRSAAAALVPDCQYIFHTGHVGSTLISRLVGAHERFFSLREPAVLRSLAGTADWQDGAGMVGAMLAVLSRTWRPEQRPVIKMTSFLSEHADSLLTAQNRPAAIFVFAQPLNYLRGILAGQHSRTESGILAPARLRRLQRRLMPHEWRAEPQSEGELLAMSWLCEMSALHQAAERHRPRVLWVDFDAFLQEPAAALAAVLRKLGATPCPGQVEALIHGPIMQRYSKGPEFAYDAALRRDVLAASDRQHAPEIHRGLEWLRVTVDAHAPLQALFAQRR